MIMSIEEIKEELQEILRWNQMCKEELCEEISQQASLHRIVGEDYEDADPDEMPDLEFYYLKATCTGAGIREILRKLA